MSWFDYCIFILTLLISVCIGSEITPFENDEPTKNITITKFDYCEGCKITVDVIGNLTQSAMTSMDARKLKPGSALNIYALVPGESICNETSMIRYTDGIKYSCVKLMKENRMQILEKFIGESSRSSIYTKNEMFLKKWEVCANVTQACDRKDFDTKTLATSGKAKVCDNCRVIAHEIDAFRRSIYNPKQVRNLLEEEFCDRLGFRYIPYAYMEDLCLEMIEERIKAILEIIQLHDQIKKTGMEPSESIPDMMCKEFFKCPPLAKVTAPSNPSDVSTANTEL